ncbi:TPA: cardiolipin synthase [Streptococcus suis]
MSKFSHPALYLAKDRGKRSMFKILFSRIGIISLLLLLQILFFIGLFTWFTELTPIFYPISLFFSYVMVIYLVNNRMNYSAKITWLIVIMAVPIFGALFYAYTLSNVGHRKLAKKVNQVIEDTQDKLVQDPAALRLLETLDEGTTNLSHYLRINGNYPVYNQTATTYYPSGETKYQALLEALEAAQDFIFLEYFIIQEGQMWGSILEILARKASQGLDVRVLYDGTNAFTKVPFDYDKKIQALGIKCKIFAPITPFLSTHYNYRDHRKIVVIDGKVAFNGGVNLADEYININSPFGHWKDAAIKLEGDAVASFTLMFLQLWHIDEKDEDMDRFIQKSHPALLEDGFVIPFADEPLDDDKVGKMVYIDILNRARRYVYIMTPYLILDGEMETAIRFAAKRGVKVRIIMPGIPDKKIPFALAKSFYVNLLRAGVEIYEYQPGFVHSKVFLSDDEIGVVGTINLDYRSLYHHFECATLLYRTSSLVDIHQDFQATLAACQKISLSSNQDRPLLQKLVGWVMRIFATLM